MANRRNLQKKKPEDSMLCGKDLEDLVLELRNLQKEKEELTKKIEEKQNITDLWMELLNAKTGTEIEEIVSNSQVPNLVPVTSEKQDGITKYNKLDGILTAYKKSGMIASSISDDDIMVQFLPTKSDTFPDKLLLRLSQNNEENRFSVEDHNMKDHVPVDELAEDYLNGAKCDIKAFIHHVTMHTSQMIKRYNLFENVRENVINKIHYNAGCTKLCIILPLQQGESEVSFELTLRYHPLDLVPHNVTAIHLDGPNPLNELQELVYDLRDKLCEKQVDVVLTEVFSDQPSEESVQSSKGTSIEGSEFSNLFGDA